MSGASIREWDAAVYDRVSDIQYSWGLEVLDRLRLDGDETVLDAGCGSGRVTRRLAERLPRGRVIAVDASTAMVERTRTAVPEAEAIVADLAELTLPEPVDVVFSTATFHWVPDHDRLFARLFDVLRPGGRLLAQAGGAGNLDHFHGEVIASVEAEPPFAEHLAGWSGPWNFPTAEATAARLRRAGFDEVGCSLVPRLVHPEEPRAFVEVVCLGHHLERLPAELHAPFVDRVVERAGAPLELDYVRLNLSARRPA